MRYLLTLRSCWESPWISFSSDLVQLRLRAKCVCAFWPHAVCCALLSLTSHGWSQDVNRESRHSEARRVDDEFETTPLNLKMPTVGGKQFWTDYVHYGKWRIQQHALTGHWRLLNPQDERIAWGSQEQCVARLEKAIADEDIKAATGDVAVLLHGLAGQRHFAE